MDIKGTENNHRRRKCKSNIKNRRLPGTLQEMGHNNRNFNQNCTNKKDKKPKERY